MNIKQIDEDTLKTVENKVKVYKTFNKSGKLLKEESEEEVIFMTKIPDGIATQTITTSKDKKVNLGNYQSAGVFVSTTVTVPMEEDQIEAAWKYVDKFTLDKLEEVLGQNFGESQEG